MIKFNKISARNFLSFGNNDNEYTFENGLCLFVGENLDNPGLTNGIGKSTLINALLYGLFGVIKGKKTKVDSVINNQNRKFEMNVEVNFSVDNDTYSVIRSRHKKASNIQLLKNGLDITSNGITNVDAYIETLLGLDAKMFTTLFVIDEGDGFMDLDEKSMKLTIEKVLNLDFLRDVSDKFKQRRLDCDRELSIKEKLLEQHNNNKSVHELSVATAQQQFDQFVNDTNNKISGYNTTLLGLLQIDTDNLLSQIDSYEKALESIKVSQQTLDALVEQKNTLVKTKEQLVNSNNALINSKDANIDKQQSWIIDHDKLINNIKTQISTKLSISEYEKLIAECDEISKHNIKITDDINATNILIQKLNNDVLTNSMAINNHKQTINNSLSKISDYKKSIINIESNIDKLQSEINSLTAGKCPTCDQSYYNNDLVTKKETMIDTFKSEIDSYNKLIIDENNNIDNVNGEIDSINYIINNINEQITLNNGTIKHLELSKKVGDSDKDVHITNKNQLNGLHDALLQLEQQLNPYDELVNNFDNSLVEQNIAKIELFDKGIAELDIKIYNLNDVINKTNLPEKPTFERDKINEIKSGIEKLTDTINNLSNATNPYEESLKLAKSNVNDVIKLIIELTDNINLLNEDRNCYNLLFKLCSDAESPLRKAILQKLLHQVNDKIGYYTQMLGLPHTVYINENLDVEIELHNDLYEYVLLSGGQRRRLNLSIVFALMSIYNYTHNPINIMMLDEVDGGKINNLGIEMLAKTLYDVCNSQKLSMTCISHSDIMYSKIANHVKIQYEYGFTSIIQ